MIMITGPKLRGKGISGEGQQKSQVSFFFEAFLAWNNSRSTIKMLYFWILKKFKILLLDIFVHVKCFQTSCKELEDWFGENSNLSLKSRTSEGTKTLSWLFPQISNLEEANVVQSWSALPPVSNRVKSFWFCLKLEWDGYFSIMFHSLLPQNSCKSF